MGDRMLPLLVAAMAFLAALALAGSVAAATLGRHWRSGAAATLTVQIPQPGEPSAEPPAAAGAQTRRDRVVALLTGTPGVASARALSEAELADLLRPWLGEAGLGNGAGPLSLPLPGVVEVHLADPAPDLDAIAARLRAAAPGTLLENNDVWVGRLATLADSLQACAWAVLALVACVAAAVIAVATRAGLAARREAIEIVHGLGATDGYIAGRFARRATGLAAAGGLIGALVALPVLLALAGLAAPFADPHPSAAGTAMPPWLRAATTIPPLLWAALPALPLAAGLIGFAAAQGTVRRWLRRLP
jgi:cell division transport system permease protein